MRSLIPPRLSDLRVLQQQRPWPRGHRSRPDAARQRAGARVGSSFQDRMRNPGFGGSFAVENIGAGYHTLAGAFSGWRDSPLNRSATRMGIAVAYAPASKYKVPRPPPELKPVRIGRDTLCFRGLGPTTISLRHTCAAYEQSLLELRAVLAGIMSLPNCPKVRDVRSAPQTWLS
jgi:hypothetical protein